MIITKYRNQHFKCKKEVEFQKKIMYNKYSKTIERITKNRRQKAEDKK